MAGEGVDEGRGAGEASGSSEFTTKVRVLGDGTLKPERAEALAVAWADGFRGDEAWRMTGGGAESYESRIRRHPVFRERVRELEMEKAKLEQEGVLGEALWAAKQNLRVARIGGVVAEVHRATVLFTDLCRAATGTPEMAPAPAEQEGAAPRGPGRPPHQPRQLRVDVEQMRDRLVQKGIAVQAGGTA